MHLWFLNLPSVLLKLLGFWYYGAPHSMGEHIVPPVGSVFLLDFEEITCESRIW